MMSAVKIIAEEIASKGPLAVAGTKEILNYGRDHTIEESLNHVALWNAAMGISDEMSVAFEAKANKKDPEFDDLIKKKKAGIGQYVNAGSILGSAFSTEKVLIPLPLTDTELSYFGLPLGYESKGYFDGPKVVFRSYISRQKTEMRVRMVPFLLQKKWKKNLLVKKVF